MLKLSIEHGTVNAIGPSIRRRVVANAVPGLGCLHMVLTGGVC